MNHFINLDGNLLPAAEPVLMRDNRSFRYGEGLFETMKLVKGKIILAGLHFDRLFEGLDLLGYRVPQEFTRQEIERMVLELAGRNDCLDLGRVRLSIFRGSGGLDERDDDLHYLIEAEVLPVSFNQLNEQGCVIDIFPQSTKGRDAYSNLKSANYLIYAMASRYARTHQLDECLVMNDLGQIADGSISNVFLVKNNLIITPALTEGCIAGVMRRYLLEKLKSVDDKLEIREGVVRRSDLEVFDEIFLTNAIRGIRWVGRYRDMKFRNHLARQLHEEFILPLLEG